MTLYRIENDVIVEDINRLFSSIDDARMSYGHTVEVEDIIKSVKVGWVRKDGEWVPPEIEGLAYDMSSDSFYQHDEYRRILHERTTNDTMEAYRKLRQGDKTIDWQAWLDTLDAYNVAIEETKNQEGYPLKVEYPEYPTKPTA